MGKVLITGGAGFIASHLADKLIKEQNEVVILDDLSSGERGNINTKAKFYNTDIRSKELNSIFKKEKPEIVFHYAAQTSVKRALEFPLEDSEINVRGSLNVLESSRRSGVKRFIFASSVAVYGNSLDFPLTEKSLKKPISPYGAAKLAIENYLNCYSSLSPVILRQSNVYGPRQDGTGEAGVVAVFINSFLNNKKPVIFGGHQTRDFLYVEDAVLAALKSIKANAGIYNVSSDKETSVNELFEILKKKIGKNIEPIRANLPKGEIERSRVSFKKISQEMNFEPKYTLEKGLEKTLDWFMH